MALFTPTSSRSSFETTDSMLAKIAAEFALILYMLAEMPVLMAAEVILMLIIFAAAIWLFMLMLIMFAEAIMSRIPISSWVSLTLTSRALMSSRLSARSPSLALTLALSEVTSPYRDAIVFS